MAVKNTIVLPVDTASDSRVSSQFGTVPLSIMDFKNEAKWEKIAYIPQLKEELRRSKGAKYMSEYGMSEFSSAVCEFIVKYWTLENAVIVDPFAGRATRAVISTKLRRKYFGYEISPSTYNRVIGHFKSVKVEPTLYLSDGCKLEHSPNESAHACITCPPYGQIERYESVEGQLSDIKEHKDFLIKIEECISNVYRVLKPGGFSCWVVGDWRYRDGSGYEPFTFDVFNLFRSAGFIPHDTVILKNYSPFAALRVKQNANKRTTSKVHETLLVFRKPGVLDLSGLKEVSVNRTAAKFFEFD